MNPKFKCVIFDLDGTILDTSEGIMESVKYTLDYFEKNPLTDEQLRTFIGPPIQQSFAKNCDVQGEELDRFVKTFRKCYLEKNLYKARPYSGILELFSELCSAGVKPAVATYKRQDLADGVLKHFGFDKYTDIICGADFEGKLTKADIIKNAMNMANISNNKDAVMIGDSNNDAKGAQIAEVPFIGVTYGFGFKLYSDIKEYPNCGVASDCYELKSMIL